MVTYQCTSDGFSPLHLSVPDTGDFFSRRLVSIYKPKDCCPALLEYSFLSDDFFIWPPFVVWSQTFNNPFGLRHSSILSDKHPYLLTISTLDLFAVACPFDFAYLTASLLFINNSQAQIFVCHGIPCQCCSNPCGPEDQATQANPECLLRRPRISRPIWWLWLVAN